MATEQYTEQRRKQLIDATISVIAKNGLVNLRVADVAKAAKLSYGVVNFYFKSKDSLLRETLDHLAAEYEAEVARAIEAAGPSSVAQLFALVDLDFSEKIAAPKKIAAWTAFWSESRATPAFRKRCCELQDHYMDISLRICREALAEVGRDDDPTLLAGGLNNLVTGLWVELQLRGGKFDRKEAKRICHAYLATAFPEASATRMGSAA